MNTPLAVPGPSPEVEAQRRKSLRRHKAGATSLLIAAAIVFLLCRWYETQVDPTATWVGFVRAAAEAGMVGGLADWFAVTALFRYPLGLKIPHTAIIPRKKDDIGNQLSKFVGENFLNADLIAEKVRAAQIPHRMGVWLAADDNAATASRRVGEFVARAAEELDPRDAEAVIRTAIIDKVAEPEWGPPLGRTIEKLTEAGQTEPIVQQLSEWLHRKALGSEDTIVRILGQRAPIWAPKFVNELVGDKVYRELITFTHAVSTDPNHEARHAIRRFIATYAQDLQHDPKTIARIENIKNDVMSSAPVHDAASTLWAAARGNITAACMDPDSVLRRKLTETALQWGERLSGDEKLQHVAEEKIAKAAAFVADNYADEITSIISETVARWDAGEASDKIELMVGKDLQYIRLNGTIVGAMAGLAIYTISHVLFG